MDRRSQERHGAVTQGDGAADCTLELAEPDFLDLTQGKADPMKLFTTGKLKISGNVMASQKLQFLQQDRSEQGDRGGGEAARRRRRRPRRQRHRRPPRQPKPREAQRAEDLRGAREAARREPGAQERGPRDRDVQGHRPGRVADVRRSAADPTKSTRRSRSPTPTSPRSRAATLRVSSIQHGKLRVDGDVSVAHRLGFLKGLL